MKRALDDLGVRVLYALSPQGKGRVERLWGTLQDRLVSELRLLKASTVAEANRALKKYVPEHNARFAVPAEQANAAWRPVPEGSTADEICALQYSRIVLNNNTVRIGRQVIDIRRQPAGRATYAKTHVLVRHLLNGRYCVFHQGKRIAQAKGPAPSEPSPTSRTINQWKKDRAATERSRKQRGVTESLTS